MCRIAKGPGENLRPCITQFDKFNYNYVLLCILGPSSGGPLVVLSDSKNFSITIVAEQLFR